MQDHQPGAKRQDLWEAGHQEGHFPELRPVQAALRQPEEEGGPEETQQGARQKYPELRFSVDEK